MRRLRVLGIIGTILSLGHFPLPWPDYHKIRHNDGPGETCAHHDHLRRWHPDAADGTAVAILHWHWEILRPHRPSEGHGTSNETLELGCPELAVVLLDSRPLIAASDSPRTAGWGPPPEFGLGFAPDVDPVSSGQSPRGTRSTADHPPPRPPSLPLLQRWTC